MIREQVIDFATEIVKELSDTYKAGTVTSDHQSHASSFNRLCMQLKEQVLLMVPW